MPTYKLLKRLQQQYKDQDPNQPRPHIFYKISNNKGQSSETFEEIGFGKIK